MENRDFTIKEMNEKINILRRSQGAYSDAKKVTDKAKELVDRIKGEVLEMLQFSELKTFKGSEGTVTIREKLAYRVPSGPEERKQFFGWLEKQKGREVLEAYQTVNSRSLNSLLNEMNEEFAARGELMFVDGIEEPQARFDLSVTKA